MGRSARSQIARIAAHASWAATDDPEARTRPARDAARSALDRRLAAEWNIPLDGSLASARRIESARRAHFQRLAYKAAQSRAKRREGAE